ncbi:MAG: hypothetical protein ACJ74O_15465 [Frankiaceae bacterium]
MPGTLHADVIDIEPFLLARAVAEPEARPMRLLSRIIALPLGRGRGEDDDPGPSAA